MRNSPLALLALCLLTISSAWAQRLPQTATPTNYKLHFTPDLKAATFDGDEIISLNINKPTNTITLNAAEITFNSITAAQKGKTITGSAQPDEKQQFAVLTFQQPLAAGPAQIHIQYKGILNDKLRGFYLSKGKDRNYATTQFESTDARRAFPSFDEPAYKATFDIALTIDKGDTAISNGSIANDAPAGEGKHTLTFTQTPKMSTYLVAMAVGDWKCSEGEQDGIPIRACSTPDKVQLTPYALKSAKEILHYYNGYYNIKWPYKKLDLLALPDFEAGAMENTAAIFYRETLLLIDDKHASVGAHQGVFDVLAHEMAHQWFGDLVTMQWWNDIWLNEGFATWMTSHPEIAVHPEWKGAIEEAGATAGVLGIDARKTTRAIRQQATTPDEINELFDGIAYGKAAAVIRMVENYVTPEVFQKGVNAYLDEHKYANATAEDFWNTQTRISGKPVDKIMKSFTEQPGEPLLTIATTCSAGANKVEGKQQRFFADKESFGSAPEQVWNIPVCLNSGNGTHCQLLTAKEVSHDTPTCFAGTFFNANGRGYYRTQYSDDGIKALNIQSLSPEEKILLLSDQWALSRAGQQSVSNFFAIAEKLSNDPERTVLEQIFQPVQTAYVSLTTDADRKQFQDWVEKTFTPLLDRVGFEPKPGESPDEAQLRPEVLQMLGFVAKDPKVIAQATSFTQKFLADPNSVDATLAPTMLGIAADNGDAKLYGEYQAAMKNMKTPEQYYAVGFSMLGFKDPALVKQTIMYATTPAVRNQDAAFIFAGTLRNPDTRDVAWPIIKENWPAIEKQMTISSAPAVVGAAGSFCTPESKQDVEQFFGQHKVPSAERTLKQAEERIDTCVSFKQDQSQNLQTWLTQQGQ